MTTANDREARHARNQAIIDEFRSNEGRVGGNFANTTLLLLSTTGAKSGQPRINPLSCLQDGDRWVVFGTKAGAPTSPDWYHNLVANPAVTVEVGTEKFEAEATVLIGEERDRIYARQAARLQVFADYEKKTTRTIPVVALTRKG